MRIDHHSLFVPVLNRFKANDPLPFGWAVLALIGLSTASWALVIGLGMLVWQAL